MFVGVKGRNGARARRKDEETEWHHIKRVLTSKSKTFDAPVCVWRGGGGVGGYWRKVSEVEKGSEGERMKSERQRVKRD